MEPLQLLLIVSGLAVASGGVFMLLNMARVRSAPHSALRTPHSRRPYTPLAVTFMGLMLAYLAYANYQTFDGVDYAIMALFAVTLLGVLGIQFFIVDKSKD